LIVEIHRLVGEESDNKLLVYKKEMECIVDGETGLTICSKDVNLREHSEEELKRIGMMGFE
jgi:hypothetical protein